MLYYHRLYRTSRGHISFCPLSTIVGDEAVLSQGALVPFILRKRPGSNDYELLGETYLHGFMDGEMITDEFKAKIAPLRII